MRTTINIFRVPIAILLILAMFSCKRGEFSKTLNLPGNGSSILVLLGSDTSYSILKRALDTTHLSSALNIYGAMTLFAPNNTAFRKYFARKKISGLSGMKLDTLTNILQYHLYAQAYPSSYFLTGSLATTTVEGDYIGMNISKGLNNTVLNGSVNIIKRDIPVTNGVVHVIDDVLIPPANTILGWLKTQPQYSIMLQAFQQTGLDASLIDVIETDPNNILYGKPVKKMRTVFLENNTVLAAAGINSFDDLARKFSNSYNTSKSYTSATDSLNIFVKYHCLPREYFISSVRDEYQESYSTGDFLIFNITGGLAINKHPVYKITYNTVTLKYDTITTNPFVGIDVTNSNVVAKNGIVNAVSTLMPVYTPAPVKVEVLFNPGNNYPIKTNTGAASTFTTGNMNSWSQDTTLQVGVPWLKWGWAANSNNMNFDTGPFAPGVTLKYNQLTTPDPYYLILTTPQILKGKYDIYLIYGTQNVLSTSVLFTWDGQPLGDLVDLQTGTDAFGNIVVNGTKNSARIERKLGTVTLSKLSIHKFKQNTISLNSRTYFYSIQLRPVN